MWVLNLSLAIIMFGVALSISVKDFKHLFNHPKATLVGLFSQFILLPLATVLLIFFIRPAPSLALGMVLVAVCPGGNISNFMSYLARGNAALSVSLTTVSSLACLIVTPFGLAYWGSFYAPSASLLQEVQLNVHQVFTTIGLIIIVPLLLGMTVKSKWPKAAAAISKVLKPLSILIFAGFVIIAFTNNFQLFIAYIHVVVFLVLAHNALALVLGYSVASVFKLAEADKKTIAIETGIQNSGLGLILIFNFFSGLGGMALVAAWWGIWHIISGLFIAFYWSRRGTAITTR